MDNDNTQYKSAADQLVDNVQAILNAGVQFQNKFAYFEQGVSHHPKFKELLEDPIIHHYWEQVMEANLKFVRLGNDDSWKKFSVNSNSTNSQESEGE